MEVLRPTLVNIGGRCYRKNPTKTLEDAPFRDEDDFESPDYLEETCTLDVNLEQTENGCTYRMQVPSAFFRFIIGKKGETKRRIENETQTSIRIPRQGDEGEIVIKGGNRKGVISAKTRIEVLVQSGRRKTAFTHFLSFPVNMADMKEKFQEFKDDVLRTCDGDRGIENTIFQNADKLHMTIGTLALMDEHEVRQATDLLHACHTTIVQPLLKGESLVCNIKGLEYMNDDPGDVDVLYAKVAPSTAMDRLQNLADRIADKFVASGLMQQDYDHVKLHITVMNTLMRKDPSGAFMPRGDKDMSRGRRERESFNAGHLLSLYRDHEFGSYRISSIQLSQKDKVAPGGYYACAGQITLP